MQHDASSGTLVLPDRATPAEGWAAATDALARQGGHAYNLIYSVSNPSFQTTNDAATVGSFNAFALAHGLHTTETVANTIFPLDTYRSHGDDFYAFYLAEVLPKVRKQWGTYFERLTRRTNDDGSIMIRDGVPLNPLAVLIDKLRRRVGGGGTTTHYELSFVDSALEIPTYDPLRDGGYQIGGPCLSHISCKLDRAGRLRLTAFYRSHWYVARALGNLIGLARLQTFVARSIGVNAGPLTIVASDAVLDLSGKQRSAAQTRALLATISRNYDPLQSSVPTS